VAGAFPSTSISGEHDLADGTIISTEAMDCAAFAKSNHAAKSAEGGWKTVTIKIGGVTFTPGTHHSASAINFAPHGTAATLDGGGGDLNSKFLFQAGTAMVAAADTCFILKNKAKAENVIWALGTAATLGVNSIVGSILAGTAITFGTGSELHVRAIAQCQILRRTKKRQTKNAFEKKRIKEQQNKNEEKFLEWTQAKCKLMLGVLCGEAMEEGLVT
jgi:hypothetical protein